MPVPVVAYEVACGSAALTSIAAASEHFTPTARMTAKKDSILTLTDVDGSYRRRRRRALRRRDKSFTCTFFAIHVGSFGALREVEAGA